MKTLLLSTLLSFSAMAADYTCRAGLVKLELKTDESMTSLIVRDVQTGEFYYNGIVSEIIERQGRTDLMFETRSHTFLQLQFKTSALNEEAPKLFGFVRGWHNGGFIDDSIQCQKSQTSL